MNEELKDILAGAGIKGSEGPKKPSYIKELETMGERCIRIAHEEDPDIAILVIVGKKVADVMYNSVSAGGSATNVLRLLRLAGETVLELLYPTTTQADPDEN